MEESTAIAGTVAGGGLIMFLYLALMIVMIAGMWKIFTKAGKPGWAVLIPIYNLYVLLQIAGKPGWWLLLMFVPFVNIVFGIMALGGLATKFGKGVGFVIGLILLPFIFYLILGFGSAKYDASAA